MSPLALEPGETFRVVLEADRAKPADRRPAFILRHLSAREFRRLDAVLAAVEGASSGGDALGRILEALRPHVVGWEHLAAPDGREIPFDPAELDAVLTMREVYDLAYAALAGGRLGDDEKKGSPSPSPSGGGSCAPAAPAAGPPATADDAAVGPRT